MTDENLTSLDEALGDAPAPEQVQPEPEVTQEATEPEVTTEPEGSTPEPEESWTKAAVLDERSKRQQYEKELGDAKTLIAQYQGYIQGLSPQEQQEAKAPDFWTDPEAALTHMRETLETSFADKLTTVEQASRNRHLNMSESMVAQTFDDFAEVKEHILKIGQENPAIIKQQLAQNPDHPWLAMYQFGKKDMELSQAGDLDSLKARLREEMKAEILAEVKADLEASNQELEKVPTSLVNQSSKGSLSASDWAGPTSLDSLIGD